MVWSKKPTHFPLGADIHSHIIPGIDDGPRSVDQSIEIVQSLYEVGFKKLITTPHIHPKYPNTANKILESFRGLKEELISRNIEVDIEAAGEYFVDHQFIEKIDADEKLLSFGDNFVLIECSFTVKPFFFESVVYKLKDKGYNPIFAHPERYKFLEGDIKWLENIKNTGILFQVTLASIGGYYGKTSKKIGVELIHNGMVDFLASDLHRASQIEFLKKGLGHKAVRNLLKSGRLLNYEYI